MSDKRWHLLVVFKKAGRSKYLGITIVIPNNGRTGGDADICRLNDAERCRKRRRHVYLRWTACDRRVKGDGELDGGRYWWVDVSALCRLERVCTGAPHVAF